MGTVTRQAGTVPACRVALQPGPGMADIPGVVWFRALLIAALVACSAACASAHAVVRHHAHRATRTTGRYSVVFASFRDGHYQIYGLASDGSTERRLTYGAQSDLEPAVSPDGRWIAFIRAQEYSSRVGSLWIMRADGGDAHFLLTGVSAVSAPSFSPDGRRISVALGSNGSRGLDIVPVAGGPGRLLHVGDRWVSDPDWSPDGREIAVSVTEGLDWVPQLVRPNGLTEPTFGEPGQVFDLSWSPNGREVAYVARGPAAVAGIFVTRLDGSHRRRVVPAGDEQLEGLAWTPDGHHLLYVARRPEAGLRIVDVRTAESRPFGPRSKGDIQPAVGPPSAVPLVRPSPGSIAFTTDRDGVDQVYTMDAGGGDLTRLSFGGSELRPAWSSDGRLTFARQAGSGAAARTSIWVTPPYAIAPERIAAVRGTCDAIRWSPDDDRLAIAVRRGRTGVVEVVRLSGARPVVVYRGQPVSAVGWYPDGRGILLTRYGPSGSIAWVRPWGGTLHYLDRGPVGGAAAAPAGGAVVGAFADHGGGGIFVATRRWRRIEQDSRAVDETPIWSPDGRWIAFWRVGYPGGHGGLVEPELAVVPSEGGHVRVLARLGRVETFDRTLAWDGSDGLVFTAVVGGRWQIARVAIGGGPVTVIGQAPANSASPTVLR